MKKSISFLCSVPDFPFLFVLRTGLCRRAGRTNHSSCPVEEVVSDEMASTSYSGGEITTRVLTLRGTRPGGRF